MCPNDAPSPAGSHSPRQRATAWLWKGWALGEAMRRGYGGADFRADLVAGATVGIIAIPLAMALAIASGMPPQSGLYTAIVAGFLAAITGGARYSVSGPTAAFVVLLAPVSATYGPGGLLIASALAGIFMVLMGISGFGKLIQFIPYPVTTGFTAGIAVVIASLQLRDFLGLPMETQPGEFFERMEAVWKALPGFAPADAVVGGFSLLVLLMLPRLTRKLPAPLAVSILGALAALAVGSLTGWGMADTIGSRFVYEAAGETRGGIPPVAPAFAFPWNAPGPDGAPIGLSMALARDLLPPAIAIALLGAIESLLCAVAADGMTGTRHDPNRELVGQGIGNMVAPFFGGFAATGAIARTAANLRAGARSPISAAIHALFALLAVLFLAPLLGYLPMATLAALLLLVAWNMSDAKHFLHIVRIAPKSDIAVLLTCFSLTVIFDMVIAVGVGIVLASLLFMRRMADITSATVLEDQGEMNLPELPEGVVVYEIRGPLFFGAAEKAIARLTNLVSLRPTAIIIHMGHVPAMDVTGLVALGTVLDRLEKKNILAILSGARPQPRRAMQKAGITNAPGKVAFCHDLEQAAMLASLDGVFGGSAMPAHDEDGEEE